MAAPAKPGLGVQQLHVREQLLFLSFNVSRSSPDHNQHHLVAQIVYSISWNWRHSTAIYPVPSCVPLHPPQKKPNQNPNTKTPSSQSSHYLARGDWAGVWRAHSDCQPPPQYVQLPPFHRTDTGVHIINCWGWPMSPLHSVSGIGLKQQKEPDFSSSVQIHIWGFLLALLSLSLCW